MSMTEDIKAAVAEALMSRDNGSRPVSEEACRARSGEIMSLVKDSQREVMVAVKDMRHDLGDQIAEVKKDTGKIHALEITVETHIAEDRGKEKAEAKADKKDAVKVSRWGTIGRWAAVAFGIVSAATGAGWLLGRAIQSLGSGA